jgi:hypothetical protein
VSAAPTPPVPLTGRDATGLLFTAEMYGLQLDQLSELLGLSLRQASTLVARWTQRGFTESAVLSPGPRWIWLTRVGLRTCGLPYSAAPPALARLAHIRAVTAVRFAFETAPGYEAASAYWRSERRLRSRAGGRVGARDHLPDAEVHWPDSAAVPWAGECWAVEAELTPKTVSRTARIMRELLARTGDYGCPAARAGEPGLPPRHARAVYLCAPAAMGTVARARETLGGLANRVEIRKLPPSASMPAPRRSRAAAAPA